MSARIIGGVLIDLSDGPVGAEYSTDSIDGQPTARLLIGDVAISVTYSDAVTVRQLADAASELAAWAALQAVAK